MERLLIAKFSLWPSKTVPVVKLPEVTAAQGKRLLLIDKTDSTQTFYQIGNVGIARTNRDRVYIRLINTLFGTGSRFTSMLNSELRVKLGLTYGASSAFDERKAPGPFVISSSTANETTEKALDTTLEILKRLHDKGVTKEELSSAKAYMKGQFPLEIETSDQLAALIAGLEFYGLDEREVNDLYAKIDSMTLSDASQVIKQYFPLDNLVFVLIGKSEAIQNIAKKYASEIRIKSISEPGF